MLRFAVIGLGRFGSRLAANLAARGCEVIGVDIDPRIIQEMRDSVTLAVALDATDEEALKMQGIDQVDVAVVGIGDNFEASAMATVTLKQLGVPRVISRAMTHMSGKILARIGADDVVNPEDESADRWCNRLVSPRFLNQFELGSGHSIVEIRVPAPWVGKSLVELGARKELGLHIVGLKKLGPPAETRDRGGRDDADELRHFELPTPDKPLEADDLLVVLGREEDLARIPAAAELAAR